MEECIEDHRDGYTMYQYMKYLFSHNKTIQVAYQKRSQSELLVSDHLP